MLSVGHLFVISAPTGGGKTTVARRAFELLHEKELLEKVITYTTRQPRLHEQNGIDYYFISLADFIAKQTDGFFLETTSYDDNLYGCPRSVIDAIEQGKSFVLVTDRAGAKTIKQLYPPAILIWLTAPSLTAIAERLQKRGRETGIALERRIAIAAQEIMVEQEHPLFDHYIVNDDLATASNDLKQLIEKTLQPNSHE